MKKNRCGKLKGNMVVDRRPQRDLYSKDETADINGAYLHAKMENFSVLTLEGESIDIICKLNDTYVKLVCLERGKNVLYLRLVKALYGCVKSSLVCYELFTTTLQDLIFQLNPYDECVSKKVIMEKNALYHGI